MTPLRSAWDRQRFLQMLIEGKQRYIYKKTIVKQEPENEHEIRLQVSIMIMW